MIYFSDWWIYMIYIHMVYDIYIIYIMYIFNMCVYHGMLRVSEMKLPLDVVGHRGLQSVNSLRWRHNGRDSVPNHQLHDCLLNRLFRCRSKKTSKLRVTGLYAGNSPGTGEFPAQIASNAKNASIWWRHHVRCSIFSQTIIARLQYW